MTAVRTKHLPFPESRGDSEDRHHGRCGPGPGPRFQVKGDATRTVTSVEEHTSIEPTPAGAGSGLDPVWQRAAVLGSLWAASEIVLGSFLHNLRLPFSGHALTAIAIVVLVAGHRTWPRPGLIVRAGLIAALMKSISPSAVLLGPMVAIAMEGVLMELAVRLFRGRVAGYALGGALAMSWTLAQKIANMLLIYGADLVVLYERLVSMAERQVGSLPLGPWAPLLVLAVVNLGFGIAAAVVGLQVGCVSGGDPAPGAAEMPARWSRPLGAASGRGPRPVLPLLLAWLAALPLGLLAFSELDVLGRSGVVATVVLAAVLRYRRALRRLARPGFWIALVALTLLSGTVMGALSPAEGMDGRAGLMIGVGMSLRAVFVTMCFAALGTELTHRVLRRWLERVGGGQLHRAVHGAFATLPLVIAAFPPARELLVRPRRTLGRLLPRLDDWLGALSEPLRVVGVVTGDSGQGKTTAVESLVASLRADGIRIGGILTPGEMRDGVRRSFDLVDLESGRRLPMGTRDAHEDWPATGPFRVNPEAWIAGRGALSRDRVDAYDLLVVDEVGPWELAGEGWGPALDELLGVETPVLMVVRRSLVREVLARFAPGGAPVWDVAVDDAERILVLVLERLRRGLES